MAPATWPALLPLRSRSTENGSKAATINTTMASNASVSRYEAGMAACCETGAEAGVEERDCGRGPGQNLGKSNWPNRLPKLQDGRQQAATNGRPDRILLETRRPRALACWLDTCARCRVLERRWRGVLRLPQASERAFASRRATTSSIPIIGAAALQRGAMVPSQFVRGGGLVMRGGRPGKPPAASRPAAGLPGWPAAMPPMSLPTPWPAGRQPSVPRRCAWAQRPKGTARVRAAGR